MVMANENEKPFEQKVGEALAVTAIVTVTFGTLGFIFGGPVGAILGAKIGTAVGGGASGAGGL